MDRKEVFENIEDRYSQSIISPVNPFTVDNPDALVFNGHSLTGVFIPLAKEMKNPDLLLRRLYLSRLSLSRTVCHVLLLIGEDELKLANNEQVNAAFDAVIGDEKIDCVLHFLSDNIHAKHYIDPRIKKEKMRRFWGTMDYIEKNGYVDRGFGERIEIMEYEVQSWSNPQKLHYSRNAGFHYPYLMARKRVTKQSFVDGYESLMTYTTMFNYSLNDGVLKRSVEAMDSFHFLNVEDLEQIVKSPMNLRTLVFLGYLPGRINGVAEMISLRDHYYSFMKDNKYL